MQVFRFWQDQDAFELLMSFDFQKMPATRFDATGQYDGLGF
jgi:hypothetical protein